jgi:hypothetical protein
MHVPQPLPQLLEQSRRDQRRLDAFGALVCTVHNYSIITAQRAVKRLSGHHGEQVQRLTPKFNVKLTELFTGRCRVGVILKLR